MADGGITEAAIVAALAEGGTAAAGSAATTAAALTAAELAAAGTAAAGSAAASAAPAVAAAAIGPEIAASTVPAIAAATPEAFSAAPLFLGATETAAVPGASSLLGPGAIEATTSAVPGGSGLLGVPSASLTSPTSSVIGSNTIGNSAWTLADKVKAGGTLLSSVSGAKGILPKDDTGARRTITPGKTGRPTGGEQALASIVEAMLKRRDAYQQGALSGAPIAYRPRGLLG